MIEEVKKEYRIDFKKIFFNDTADDTMMCYRLACEVPEEIKAMAPAIATMPENLLQKYNPKTSISILTILRIQESVVPFKGGNVKLNSKMLGRCISAESKINFCLIANYCIKDSVETNKMEDTDKKDGITVTKQVYNVCQNSKNIHYYTRKVEVHPWPGSKSYLPQKSIGFTCNDFHASLINMKLFKSLS